MRPPLTAAELTQHAEGVRALARRLVADADAGDDLVQDACVAALDRPPASAVPLRAWFVGVVRNLARRTLRGAAARRRRERTAARAESVPAAASVAAEIDVRRRVLDAVANLDEPYRTAVALRYLDGLAPREIAARLGVPGATVNTRVHRGLAMLRARLAGAGDDWRAALLAVAIPRGGGRAGPVGLEGALAMTGKKTAALVLVLLAFAGGAAIVRLDAEGTGGAPGGEEGSAATATEPERVAPRAAHPSAGDVERPATPPPAAAPATIEETPDPELPVEVAVLRSDGSPASGATVVLVADTDDGTWAREIGRASCAADGLASLRVPGADVRVVAWLDGDAAATEEIAPASDGRRRTLRLGPAIAVRGTVVRGDGTPESAADVELSASPWYGSSFGLAFRTRTDRSGGFAFPPLPLAGIDALNPPCVEATTSDRARGWAEVDPARPGEALAVRLTPGFTLRGRLVDGAGQPVAADVWAVGASRRRESVAAGAPLAFRLDDAAYAFVALRTTERIVTGGHAGGVPAPTRWRVARALGRHERGAGDVDAGDVVFRPGRPVAGRVVDVSGRAASRARVALSLCDHPVGWVLTDADGRFVLPEVGDDPHRIDVRSDDGPGPVLRAEVDGVRGGDAERAIVVRAALAVTLRFVSADTGLPVAACDVRVSAARRGSPQGTAAHSVGGDDTAFTFALPAAGAWNVDVFVGGFEPARVEGIEVRDGADTVVDVVLRPRGE